MAIFLIFVSLAFGFACCFISILALVTMCQLASLALIHVLHSISFSNTSRILLDCVKLELVRLIFIKSIIFVVSALFTCSPDCISCSPCFLVSNFLFSETEIYKTMVASELNIVPVIKQNKVVVVLSGRYAGKKAIVVKAFAEGNKKRKFGHALIAGIAKAPRAVTKSMSKKKIERRSRVKAFVKFVNFQHIMPTRYSIQSASGLDVQSVVPPAKFDGELSKDDKKALLKDVRNAFTAKYLERGAIPAAAASGVQYFFQKLRF
jgi:large subunit ribosomal protein L27e